MLVIFAYSAEDGILQGHKQETHRSSTEFSLRRNRNGGWQK